MELDSIVDTSKNPRFQSHSTARNASSLPLGSGQDPGAEMFLVICRLLGYNTSISRLPVVAGTGEVCNMAVLVTGGMGYIGSHTCLELLESGYEVVSVDNMCNSSPVSLRRVEELTNRSLKSYEGDVRDEALLRRIFSENEIECVIHFAGLKAVGESVEKPWAYYDNNLNATLVLTKVMKEVGVQRIIFSSSATVYTADNQMPLRETSRTGAAPTLTAGPSI